MRYLGAKPLLLEPRDAARAGSALFACYILGDLGPQQEDLCTKAPLTEVPASCRIMNGRYKTNPIKRLKGRRGVQRRKSK